MSQVASQRTRNVIRNKMREFQIAIDPVPAPRQTVKDKWKPSARVIKYRAFKDELQWKLKQKGLLECPTEMSLVFYLEMPISWTEKKRIEHSGAPHQSRPDIDNLVKAVMDSWRGEDSHVWKIQAEKYWADKPLIKLTCP